MGFLQMWVNRPSGGRLPLKTADLRGGVLTYLPTSVHCRFANETNFRVEISTVAYKLYRQTC